MLQNHLPSLASHELFVQKQVEKQVLPSLLETRKHVLINNSIKPNSILKRWPFLEIWQKASERVVTQYVVMAERVGG